MSCVGSLPTSPTNGLSPGFVHLGPRNTNGLSPRFVHVGPKNTIGLSPMFVHRVEEKPCNHPYGLPTWHTPQRFRGINWQNVLESTSPNGVTRLNIFCGTYRCPQSLQTRVEEGTSNTLRKGSSVCFPYSRPSRCQIESQLEAMKQNVFKAQRHVKLFADRIFRRMDNISSRLPHLQLS
jgi:hypothetical protein